MSIVFYKESEGIMQSENEKPTTPKEAYADLGKEQFNEFARIHMKEAIIGKRDNVLMDNISRKDLSEINSFFENIPEYLLDFKTDSSCKLIMMYISSNLQNAFGMQFGDNEYCMLYNAIMRIKEVNPI